MYTLYHHPFSQHARRVVAFLESAGLAYRLESVQLDQGEHMSADFLALNPNHQVPVLVDGEFVLTESNAILRYLAHKHQLWNWYPQAPAARARVEQWLDWNQCRLSPRVIQIVLNKVFLGPQGDAQAIASGLEALPELWQILARQLEAQDFLAGPEPTLADLSVASNLAQLALAEVSPESEAVARWYQQVAQLPGFQRALPQLAPSTV